MVKRIVIISSHPIHNGTFYQINSLEDIVDFPDKVDKGSLEIMSTVPLKKTFHSSLNNSGVLCILIFTNARIAKFVLLLNVITRTLKFLLCG